MPTPVILRIVALGALIAAVPVLTLAQMPDIALALAACSAVSAVLSMRHTRES